MGLFKRTAPPPAIPPPDPKDEIIAVLREQVTYLRAHADSLQQQLLALHSSHAYRLLYPSAEPPPGEALPTNPFDLRHEVHQPEFSLAELMTKSEEKQ